MIGQTEIDKSSNYGNKERQINNNWKTVIHRGNKIMLLWGHEGISEQELALTKWNHHELNLRKSPH